MRKFWLHYLGKLGLWGVGTMIAGGGIRAVLEILPYTGYPISQGLARVLFWLSIGIVLSGLVLIIIALVRHEQKEPKEKPQTDKIEKESLLDTLTAMHRRLIELQKEKAAHTKVSLGKLKKVLPTLADRMGTVKHEDWPKFEHELKLRIRRACPPRPYMNFRGRFNFRRWAKLKEEWKEEVYRSALSVATKAKDELLHTKEWTLADGIKVAEWLDGYDWGIKKLRDDDARWKALYESIDNYLIDGVLRDLIKEHIDLSHVYNNMSLIIHYSGKFKHDIYSLMLYAVLVGGPMSPEQVDMGLNEILGKIEKRLKEMDNE